MTHSSHSRYESALLGRRYEVALSELILEEKEYLAGLDPHHPLFEAKFTPRFTLLVSLEAYRRSILEGVPPVPEADRRDIDRLVRSRMAGDDE